MKNREAKYVSIRVKPEAQVRLEKLCEIFGRQKYEMANDCFEYLLQKGYDPKILDNEPTTEELKKLRNTLVSFIREQERTILKPMVEKVDRSVVTLVDFIREQKQNEFPILQEDLLNNDNVKNEEHEFLKKEHTELKIKYEKIVKDVLYIRSMAKEKKNTIYIEMGKDEFKEYLLKEY